MGDLRSYGTYPGLQKEIATLRVTLKEKNEEISEVTMQTLGGADLEALKQELQVVALLCRSVYTITDHYHVRRL